MARACDDGREDGARGVVTGETSLAHACLHEQRQKVEEQSQKVLGAVPSGSADEGGEGGGRTGAVIEHESLDFIISHLES